MNEDVTSLAHTKWRCQYHLVFAPKYRRQIIYGKYKVEIGKILRKICERMEGVEIIEANACVDHIHMLVTIPPKVRAFRCPKSTTGTKVVSRVHRRITSSRVPS